MNQVRFPEFRAELGPTGYPFSPLATLTNAAGDVIPDGVFLDASLYPVGGREGSYLSAVVVAADEVTLVFGDAGTSARASGKFSRTDPPPEVALYDTAGRPAGVLVSEPARLAAFRGWAEGAHKFDARSAPLVASVCRPVPDSGVTGFSAGGVAVSGEVWLVGEDGVVLSTSPADDPVSGPVTAVRVDVAGDPLYRRRLCDAGDVFAAPRFVTSIRVVSGPQVFYLRPDEFGDVKLTSHGGAASDTVLRVRTTQAGLVFEAAGPS